jgi:predicted small lipoprotein YifL
MRRLRRSWPLVAVLLLAGCGMYGSLYLEEDEARSPRVTEQPPVAADEDEDEDEAAGRP